jgi:type IV pilus assembly protein PilE
MRDQEKPQRGFTLIEVMIVVVIIGIIAAIAYPAYARYIQNTRMATAQGDLMELAQWMERQYSLNNSYLDGGAVPAVPPAFGNPPVSPREGTAAYTLSLQATDNTFTLTASPTGPQVGHWCGNLSLTHAGVRGATGADPSECWR